MLLEAAKKSQGTVTDQTLQMAAKLSVQIDAAIKQSPHRKVNVFLDTASATLQEDSTKCLALLNSEMTPDAFVRGMLTSAEDHESSAEAEADDITKVGVPQSSSNLVIAASNQSQQSSEATNHENKESQVSLKASNSSGANQPSGTPTDLAGDQAMPENSASKDIQQSAKLKSPVGIEFSPGYPETVPQYGFQHRTSSQLQDYLRSHGLSAEGDREELITRCQAKQKELARATQEPKRPLAEVDTAASKLSTSSDPPASPSRVMRALKSLNPFASPR